MKRTRETIFYEHPNERWNISGATKFDGEDLNEEQRRKQNQQIQKQWLLEQMEQKQQKKAEEKATDL